MMHIADSTDPKTRRAADPKSREDVEGPPRPPSWASIIRDNPWWDALSPEEMTGWPIQLRGAKGLVLFFESREADALDVYDVAEARDRFKVLVSASRARYADRRNYRREVDDEDQKLLSLVEKFNQALARHRERVLPEWEAIRCEAMRPPVHDLSPTASH